MTQNRFKSWALWLSTASFILFILKQVLNIDVNSETFNTAVNLLLIALTEFGILNSPTSKDRF